MVKGNAPPAEVVWRPGKLDRARALARRLLVATVGSRGEARAHSAYHGLLRRLGRFGPPEDTTTMAALRAVASRSRTIIDVGANVGRYSWFLRRHARGDTTLIALEPHPGSARLLRGAIGGVPGSMVLEVAAADTDGSAALIVPTGAFGSSIAGLAWIESGPHGGSDVATRIAVRRLDGLIEDGTITVVGPVLMKIDVEGGEAKVLRGATDLLKRHRPIIYLECQASLLARIGGSPDDVWADLRRAGYRIFAIRGGMFVSMSGVDPGIVNYLCIPDVGPSDSTELVDLAAFGTVLDAWARHTQQLPRSAEPDDGELVAESSNKTVREAPTEDRQRQ